MTFALRSDYPSLQGNRVLRLRLAPYGAGPRRLDGAWWPRTDDLLTELPRLLAGIPSRWGHISSVLVNGAHWAAAPGRLLVANQVVRLRRATAPHPPHTVALLSPSQGRRDLLVVPPDTDEATATALLEATAERGA